jgi:hypothetical protein
MKMAGQRAVATALCSSRAQITAGLRPRDEMYFVRDGHHRISVARAPGETCIDPEITAWETASAAAPVPATGLVAARVRSAV